MDMTNLKNEIRKDRIRRELVVGVTFTADCRGVHSGKASAGTKEYSFSTVARRDDFIGRVVKNGGVWHILQQ